MDQTEVFLTATMPRLGEAETALHHGDPQPRMEMWSHTDPVTLFGAAMSGTGWSEIQPIFHRLAASFSDFSSYENEVIAAGASDSLAYTVAHERTSASVRGGQASAYVLRVTTVFRLEAGAWKVVHRHADTLASPTARGIHQEVASGSEIPTYGQRVLLPDQGRG